MRDRSKTISLLFAALLILALTLPMVGCGGGRPSGLTEPQVDQMLDLQQNVQVKQNDLNRQRDQLEEDRRTWDARARRDPIIAKAVEYAGLMIACCLPLALILVLVWPRTEEPDTDVVCDILVEEITSDQPKLIGTVEDRPRIEQND